MVTIPAILIPTLVICAIWMLCACLLLILFRRDLGARPPTSISALLVILSRLPWWKGRRSALVGAGWGIILATIGIGWLRILLNTGNYLPIPAAASPADWALLVILAPAAEEFFFRGALLAWLLRFWRSGWAIFLTVVAYLITHPYQPWLAFLVLANIGYAHAYRGSCSIAGSIIAHALVTAAFLHALGSPAFVVNLPPWAFAAAGLIGIIILVLGRLPRPTKSTPSH